MDMSMSGCPRINNILLFDRIGTVRVENVTLSQCEVHYKLIAVSSVSDF